MPNHLLNQTSRYLLQHAHQPVDWYPWGPEALEKAQRENKPIFLSIGYSACHWCHVMAHESFEDENIAAILNEHFVSIKVDREERPDLDRLYMAAVQAMTGGGGWPMSVFLTPEGTPFYGGTYFPPEPRYGMPAFAQVLTAIVDAWQNRRHEITAAGQQLVKAIEQQMSQAGISATDLKPETLDRAFRAIRQSFDHVNGGWGSAPKFPQPMTLEFLLRYHLVTGDSQALQMVTQTLEAMARGGMYDQLGGGFHRYSVDATWTTPHFEKMLYDNAQLARVYLHAWQLAGQPFFRAIAEEILDYVLREMTDPAGGFYSTQDADSEGEEGKFFLWTPAEIRAALGAGADRFMQAYGVTAAGNFEGKNILVLRGTLEEREALAQARRTLLAIREQRVPPGRDEKVLASWNGLLLAALAEAARALDRPDYRQAAVRNGDFLLSQMRDESGRLWHVWNRVKAKAEAKVRGQLEDYADVMEGLIELYQTTFEPRWYVAAQELARQMLEHFSAPNGFFDTAADDEALIVRTRDLYDNATPSGNAMAATVLLKLAGLAVEPRYAEIARQSLAQAQDYMARAPLGFGQWLVALEYSLAGTKEIAVAGDLDAPDTRALLQCATSGFRPHQVIAAGFTNQVPLLNQRVPLDGKATAYVCSGQVCRAPVTDLGPFKALIG